MDTRALPYPLAWIRVLTRIPWHGYACSPVSGVAWIRVLSRTQRGTAMRALPYPTWHGTSGEKGKSQVAVLSGVLRVGTFEILGM